MTFFEICVLDKMNSLYPQHVVELTVWSTVCCTHGVFSLSGAFIIFQDFPYLGFNQRVSRWHPHVRRSGAVWVGVCARGRHLLHSAHPDRTADGGVDYSYLALAHGGGWVLQPGLLPGLTRLPQRVFRLVVHHNLAFPVEGVRHHVGQLSSSLHNQIPEAQVFTSELL